MKRKCGEKKISHFIGKMSQIVAALNQRCNTLSCLKLPFHYIFYSQKKKKKKRERE